VEIYENHPAATAAAPGVEDHQGPSLVIVPSKLGRPPVTGIMVPGTQAEVALGPLAVARLKIGTTYLWRVVGIDKGGKAVCESPLKEIAW